MKRLIIVFSCLLAMSSSAFAQEISQPAMESAKPVKNAVVVRKLSEIDVEGTKYENVTVTMKSKTRSEYYSTKDKVQITITDMLGKTLWKKTFKNVFLYVFSDGQVQIGQGKFVQALIEKLPQPLSSGDFKGKIREKVGIF